MRYVAVVASIIVVVWKIPCLGTHERLHFKIDRVLGFLFLILFPLFPVFSPFPFFLWPSFSVFLTFPLFIYPHSSFHSSLLTLFAFAFSSCPSLCFSSLPLPCTCHFTHFLPFLPLICFSPSTLSLLWLFFTHLTLAVSFSRLLQLRLFLRFPRVHLHIPQPR